MLLANMAPTRSAALIIVMIWASLFLLPLSATFTQQAPLVDTQAESEASSSHDVGAEGGDGLGGTDNGNATALQISIPQATPDSASDVVDRAYPALAISMHSFQEYAGNATAPNLFSRNLIDQIARRTGTNVHVRVGGTSGDYAVYNPDQEEAISFPPGYVPGGIPRGMLKGRAWFEGFANFPGVKWTYMAHLANDADGMLENSVLDVQEALKYIGSDLEALEIGNEIDFYRPGSRPASYNAVAYLAEWNTYERAIRQAVGAQPLQGPVFANNNFPFSIENIFDKGQNANGHVVSASLHPYMTGQNLPVSSRQSVFMNHTNIVNRLNIFKAPVAYLKANQPHVPLHLGETNSNTFSMNNEDVTGVFGSTLWLADFLLYGASLNIKRVNVQQSTGFSYTSWRAIDYYGKPAAVLPPYYAHPFFADVIGNSGDVRIQELALGLDLFSAYAIYDTASDTVIKVALINLEDWIPAQGDRPVQEIQLNIGDDQTYGGQQDVTSETNEWQPPHGSPWHNHATVQKLTAPGADTQDAGQITWADQSWTYESNGIAYENGHATKHVRGSRGTVSVQVQASEAVLVTL